MRGLVLLFLLGCGAAPEPVAETPEAQQLWTCGMHPHVLEHGPGQCPICGMNLVPVESSGGMETGGGEREILFYRNPMDPTITSPVPAKDSMGMDYVPVYAGEATGTAATVRIDPSVVQNMKTHHSGGSSRIFNSPFHAACDSWCASSTMKTRNLSRLGG